MNITVIGAGAWGTALAIALSEKHALTLWGRDAKQLEGAARSRINARALPGITLPAALNVEGDFAQALAGADLALIATTTSGLGEAARAVHARQAKLPIIWACKGFDRVTGKLPHETIGEMLGGEARFGVLSGPSFALEVAKGLPCALTLACNDNAFAQSLAAELNGGSLRVYSNADLVGVELGGALKNVMAIAAGICDGMQLGLNARAALVTRGLAEMMRLGVAMGGKAETFTGLTGLGDLVLTATGNLSRNRMVGLGLAEGRPLAAILASLGHVAEGVNSAETTFKLARKHGVEMPITEAVCAILFHGADARATVQRLLSREARAE
ncbi:MAG TPA: NAD(P)H-dependent glycerol-3-phosphate dehydrogenase [Usitatibacteraceae bacterium]